MAGADPMESRTQVKENGWARQLEQPACLEGVPLFGPFSALPSRDR
jgi:hypothetical protein